MKIENVEVYGFRAALRGMRNPMESWAKSDSLFGEASTKWTIVNEVLCIERPVIGPNDLGLACRLIKAGSDHRKFMRQITVTWDITIPIAIWYELDTYKVATVRNSCSTMHKLGTRDVEPADFDEDVDLAFIAKINKLGEEYRADKTPEKLHRLRMNLPWGFNHKSTYTFSYETALNMWRGRHDHRMPEWSGPEGICAWLERLPYMPQFLDAAGRV